MSFLVELQGPTQKRMKKTKLHKWTFTARFRRNAFGWKGSRLACQRIKEAVSEIKKVTRKDTLLGAEGTIKFMEKLWPALQHVDSSSGALGTAVYNAMGVLVGIVIEAPVDEKMEEYTALQSTDFIEKDPRTVAVEFGNEDPIKEMISLAAINAICQHVMRETHFVIDSATDSLGLLSVSAGDRVGMVGLFFGLIKTIENAGAELVIIEKKRPFDFGISESANYPGCDEIEYMQ